MRYFCVTCFKLLPRAGGTVVYGYGSMSTVQSSTRARVTPTRFLLRRDCTSKTTDTDRDHTNETVASCMLLPARCLCCQLAARMSLLNDRHVFASRRQMSTIVEREPANQKPGIASERTKIPAGPLDLTRLTPTHHDGSTEDQCQSPSAMTATREQSSRFRMTCLRVRTASGSAARTTHETARA